VSRECLGRKDGAVGERYEEAAERRVLGELLAHRHRKDVGDLQVHAVEVVDQRDDAEEARAKHKLEVLPVARLAERDTIARAQPGGRRGGEGDGPNIVVVSEDMVGAPTLGWLRPTRCICQRDRGETGRDGERRGDVGRDGERRGDTGRGGEMGRYGEMRGR